MSLIGKITRADHTHSVRDRVLRDIAHQVATGWAEVGVIVSQSEIRGRLDTFARWPAPR